MGDLRYADVVEGVRATLAAYAHALDDGRVEDVVATFTTDGTVDLPGMGVHSGTEELLAAYSQWVPRLPQRHLIVNTHVGEWSDDAATAVSDLVFLLKREDAWAVQMVGRYHDELRRVDAEWRFHHRRAEFS